MAFELSVETVMVNASTTRSFLSIPYSAAVSIILFAISILPSAVLGIPVSSRQRQTVTPPYFLTSGKTACIELFLPLTELIIALPL